VGAGAGARVGGARAARADRGRAGVVGRRRPGGPAELAALREALAERTAALARLQGETPLMRVEVDASIVGEVISGWTGVPVGRMLRDQLGVVLNLERHLGERIIGQDDALAVISRRVRTTAAKIEDPHKPKGVFMLVGPSGVGKTETALALGDLLYGGEQNVVTINMSEFQEAHTVSTLKGSPPGYVGYGEGGVLTEAVRRRPHSVVLLDEVEKAHPDVLELFFQVFDKGVMEDGEGRQIDFRNTIILLTTNAGTDTIMRLTADPETAPDAPALARTLKPELDKTFKPAFLGRMVVVPYYPVRDEALRRIIGLKLRKVERRLFETHRVELLDRRRARRRDRGAVHRGGERRAQRRQHPHQLGAPRGVAPAAGGMAEGTRPGALRVGVGADGELTFALSALAGGELPAAGSGAAAAAAVAAREG
jgi:type VI secretion system protein VasG